MGQTFFAIAYILIFAVTYGFFKQEAEKARKENKPTWIYHTISIFYALLVFASFWLFVLSI